MSVDEPLPPEVVAAQRAEAEGFIDEHVEDLGLIAGLRGLDVRIGSGWAVNPEDGSVTVDPTFFSDAGYRPEWCVYATMHELVAHVREVVNEPALTREMIRFCRRGKEFSLFHNIMADIAGNRELHQRMPVMRRAAKSLYSERLFDETDYTELPRHIQFLYSIIRREMVPGEDVQVSEEVAEAVGRLRDFEGSGRDAILAATDPRRTPRERFELMTGLILPEYLRLLKQDRQDERFKPKKKQGQEGGEKSESGPGSDEQTQSTSSGETENEQQHSSGAADQEDEENGASDGKSGDRGEAGDDESSSSDGSIKVDEPPDFTPFYEDYEQKQPRPISDQEKQQFARNVDRHRREHGRDATERARKALESETGQPIEVIEEYRRTLRMFAAQIEEMDEFFDRIITKRLAQRRKLSKPSGEGILLDPALLAQTHVDVQSGVSEPSGLLDFEVAAAEQEIIGGYDLHLLLDTSGSMEGDKAKSAANSAMIFLEGFHAFAERVEQIQDELGIKLDLDIATSVLEFGDYARTLKPLNDELTERQRIQTYAATLDARGSATQDYSALEEVIAQKKRNMAEDPERPRKSIVVVVTDGGSSKPVRARETIDELRRLGVVVIGIGITDTNAEELYSPFGRTIDEPKKLPGVLIGEIERVMKQREGGVL